ncbi:S8 family serine peptidase [Bacillus sp. FJAT-27445]|uniref:S8 family serine peptidase n=1 Tax=Bacillus sp. FJAT-27445 TaxID=1679166 RepID=UPI0007432AE3|nr:S8 family serine peptidase [Bacillus sp. FJAT-27445]
MRFKRYRNYSSKLLIFAIIFSFLLPGYGHAADLQPKKDQLSNEAILQMKSIIAAQEAQVENGPVLHPDLESLTGDEEVSVIVELSEPPVALVKGMKKVAGKSFSKADEKGVEQKVFGQQKKFENAMNSKGIKAKKGFEYSYTYNGMSLKLKANQVKKLLAIPDVVLVEPDLEVRALGTPSGDDAYSRTATNSNNFLDVPSVWDMGFEGQNVKVAVLDTGIDYNHPEFEGVYKGGYNFINQTTAAGYSRTRADNDPYETSPLDRLATKAEFDSNGNSFYTEHGTHVAGTIAAQGKNPYSIKGIAPRVELYAYRVLGAYGSGATSGIIAGIDKAAQEKMDIINMSLGGSSNSQTASDAIAVNNAALAGTAAIIATGNSGPNRGTIGNPGTAAFAISVGNSTIPEDTKKANVNVAVAGSQQTSYNLNMMGWKFGSNPEQILNGTYEVIAIPNFGVEADYAGLDVNGKVALVSRGGSVPFVDKIAAAKKAGAISVIIHNNGTGGNGPAGILLGDSFPFIPAFDMSTTDGTALRTAMAGKTTNVTFNNFESGKTVGDEINNSSSRGPANPTFDIKPDVSAPGTNIMSSVPAYKKDFPNANYSESYARFTGTSMATPHVTAIAALLKSQHPNWTPFDLKVAISNTAKQLDTAKYDVFSQGPGRAQPLKAVMAEALAYSMDKTSFSSKTYDNIKGTVTFGIVPTSTVSATTISKDIVVKNLTGNASDYTVSVQVTKAATGTIAGANVTVDKTNFNLTGETTIKATLNVPKGSGTTGNELLGYIHITNGTTKLILPFAASFAPPTGLKSFSIDSNHISPNGDGKLDSTTVRYDFHTAQRTTYLELWDAANQEAGYYGDGYLGYLVAANSTSTGPKTAAFNGQITQWGTGTKAMAPDGVYTLDLTTLNLLGTAIVTFNWIGPIYVKSTPSNIVAEDRYSFSGPDYSFNSAIEDSYVNFGPTVEEVFGIDYDVNANLHPKYELTNSTGDLVSSGPITLSQDGAFDLDLKGLTLGENKLKIIVEDEAQNHAEKEIVLERVDNTNPATNVAITGTEGANGWYTSNVKLELTATDEEAGVQSTEYKIGEGEWTAYTEAIELANDGIHQIQFRSTDNAGNVEEAQSIEVKFDKTAPILKATVDKAELFPPNNKFEKIKVTLAYSDAVSGIESVVLESIKVNDLKYNNDGIQDATYGTQDVEFSLRASKNSDDSSRIYTITYIATDKAGNTTKATTTVIVPKNKSGK